MSAPARGDAWGAHGALLCLIGAAAAAWTKARSWDLWWHLETGEQILARRIVPRVDDFSFTSLGVPWIDHEWLFQVVLHLAWSALGPSSLFLLKALAVACAAGAGFVMLRRHGAGGGVAAAVVAWCLAGMRWRLAERPEIATLALAPIGAALLVSLAQRPTRPARRLVLLAACGVAWVNLHAGALLLPLLAAACLAASLFPVRAPGTDAPRVRAVTAGLALAISAAALLVNPYGHHVYLVPGEIARALAPANLVNPEWSAPTPAGFPFLYLTGIACAVAAAMSIRSRAQGSAPRAAMLVVTWALALTSVRHAGIAYVLAPVLVDPRPLLARAAGAVPSGGWRRGVEAAGAIAALVACALMIVHLPPAAERGVGLPEGRFPERAIDFIDARYGALEDVRLYNEVRHGGYLIRRGYPARRVFIDGRNEVHAALLADLSASLDDGARWQALLARHGVEGAVVTYKDRPVRLQDGSWSTFSETHFPSRQWALVYWDDLALVYVRRDGRLAVHAPDREYTRVRPEAFRLGLVEPEQSPADAGLREEILARLREDPDCRLAKSMASVYGIGERDR